MKITKDEIEHVAHLARLNLGGDELDAMTEKVGIILSYVEKLNALDTRGVEPTTHAFSITNAFRDDVVHPSLSQNEALANCMKQDGRCFIVPRIL